VLEALRALLERRRAGERAQLERGLRDGRFAATLSAWRALAATPLAADGAKARPDAARPIEAVAGHRIRRVYRRMVRDGRRIDDDSPPEALHELRKRGKELRYLLELFGGPFPKDVVKPLVRTLKDLQDVLGRFQDRAVQVELLGGLREELDAPARAALEPALAALEADQRAARGEFATRFEPFAADEQRAVVRETFRAA
jgi:CHAD domain-containing protein